jgi:sulfatase modifying factor 1
VRLRAAFLLALLLVFPAACSSHLAPEGQVVLSVGTDAPLPAGDGRVTPGAPALFDRLRFEIFPPGELAPCAGCARDFAVDAATVAAGRASVGIVPPPRTPGIRVRVQLFRSYALESASPRPSSTLQAVVALPAIAGEGLTELTVFLRTETLGTSAGDLEHPVEPEPGFVHAELVGTFGAAYRRACSGAPGSDEVCVPGGVFWMGDPLLDGFEGARERLVALSPYYLDRAEVTAAHILASGLAIRETPDGPSLDPREHGDNTDYREYCVFRGSESSTDDRAVNCVSWELAQRYCEAQGKTIPTEAQYEFAARGRGISAFVWGYDAPRCEDAVFHATESEGWSVGSRCGGDVSPSRGGLGRRDVLALPDGSVVDLAGNVAEWTLDLWNRDTEPCWAAPLLVDPLCTTPSATDGLHHSARGGAFDQPSLLTRAGVRPTRLYLSSMQAGTETWVRDRANIGFRCARPDTP